LDFSPFFNSGVMPLDLPYNTFLLKLEGGVSMSYGHILTFTMDQNTTIQVSKHNNTRIKTQQY